MKVRFLGPNGKVNTLYGTHLKGEVREYPDAVGKELIETGVRNKFEEVKAVDANTGATGADTGATGAGTGAEAGTEAKGKRK